MSPRTLVAVLAVAITALATPGYAEDAEKGVKVDAEFAGSITRSTVYNQLPEGARGTVACVDDNVSGGDVSTDPPGVTQPDVNPAVAGCAAPPAPRGADSPGSLTGFTVTGHCTFAGVLTPNNRLNITYGGFVKATGPQVPQLTYAKCTVSNNAGQSAFSEFANGGAVSATHGATSPWFVSPVTVCVEGFAVYGPTPVVIVDLAKTCHAILA